MVQTKQLFIVFLQENVLVLSKESVSKNVFYCEWKWLC